VTGWGSSTVTTDDSRSSNGLASTRPGTTTRRSCRRSSTPSPDVHHHIERVVADGRNVWALYTMTGTHAGPIRGVPPTGKGVRYAIVAMYQIDGGVITEADFVSDDLRMMRQLGALPD
jgi:predicted ester cyclase